MPRAEAIAETLKRLGGPKKPKVSGSVSGSWNPSDFAVTPEGAEAMERAIEERLEQVGEHDNANTW
jgi:hypothetical protein